MDYRYRGRHRKPANTGRVAVCAATVGAVVTAPVSFSSPAFAAATMPAHVRSAIVSCESGGKNVDRLDIDGASTASGFYQFVDGTWRAFGGAEFAPRAVQASRAEQDRVADRAFAANGLRDWEASRACWGPKVDNARTGVERVAETRSEVPRHGHSGKHVPGRHRASEARPAMFGVTVNLHPSSTVYTVQRGDTLSKIAAMDGRHGITVASLVSANHIVNQDCINVGQKLALQ